MKEVTRSETELLLKCLRAEASDYEQVRAWNWIHENESNRAYYHSLKEAWIANAINKPTESVNIEESWRKVEQKIKISNSKPFTQFQYSKKGRISKLSLSWQGLAAAVIGALLIGGASTIVFFNNQVGLFSNYEQYSIIESPRGSKTLVTLSDGSKVWLNAESRLRFNRTFNKNNRDVYLEGEGYFVVSKNENLNFRVHTSDIIIKAIGTEFNVKAYPEEGRIETTLVEGSVSISRNEPQRNAQTIVLKPNQKASFLVSNPQPAIDASNMDRKDNQLLDSYDVAQFAKAAPQPARLVIENNINTEVITSWKEKRWVFERERMISLVAKLERQYDIDFIFLDPELKDFHLTGTLEEESLEQVLKALQLTLPIDFRVDHNHVYLSINQELLDSYKQILRPVN